MLRRIMYLSFHPDPEGIARWEAAARETAQRIPSVTAWNISKLEPRGDEWQYIVEGVFTDVPALQAYLAHPYHSGTLHQYFVPGSPVHVGKRADIFHYEPLRVVAQDRHLKQHHHANYTFHVEPAAQGALEERLVEAASTAHGLKNWSYGRTTQEPGKTAWTHVLEYESAAPVTLSLPSAPSSVSAQYPMAESLIGKL